MKKKSFKKVKKKSKKWEEKVFIQILKKLKNGKKVEI